MPANDKTNYAQSLTHLIKGNLGAGILAMPASFAHTGLVGAFVGLPLLCLVSAFCVHILVQSARALESSSKGLQLNYANLARQSLELGPKRLARFSQSFGLLVDALLLVTQVGICCVYIVFVVDNLTSILASYQIVVPKSLAFLAVFPVILLLSFIRTLNRLAVSSLLANLLQAIGLALIVEYLARNLASLSLAERDNFRPLNEMALGFGSAMFAFEGISVILPVYSRMRRPRQMSDTFGIVNVSYGLILVLYFAVGLLGYLKFGSKVRDSITLNLPAEPLYDAVRGMFTLSIVLSYPLQFYVPNEIIWEWAKKNLLRPTKSELSVIRALEVALPAANQKPTVAITLNHDRQQHLLVAATRIAQGLQPTGAPANAALAGSQTGSASLSSLVAVQPTGNETTKPASLANLAKPGHAPLVQSLAAPPPPPPPPVAEVDAVPLRYEYCCRLVVVTITFALAFSVPKLNLLMDLIGSFSGAALCLTIPAIIHLAAFWSSRRGFAKALLVTVDCSVIVLSLLAGGCGSLSSFISIARSFSS